jgi:hypothetical protein
MAEGKKSFVLYSDQREIFEQLSDDQAGRLIKHIYSYVNDEDPVTDDLIIKIAFTPIKMQLKRDLKKWETQQEQRKEAGRKSAEVRKRALTEVNERSISSTGNVNVNGNVNNNKAFVVDANFNEKEYRSYLFNLIKNDYEKSRDELFLKCKIDISRRNEIWENFIKNSILNVPLIENEKHAWNTFKKYITDNKEDYKIKHSDFKGFD